jgi:hypothetical protein
MTSLTNRHCQPCDLSLHMNDLSEINLYKPLVLTHSSHRELLILIVASRFFLVFFGFGGCSYCGGCCCCVVLCCVVLCWDVVASGSPRVFSGF